MPPEEPPASLTVPGQARADRPERHSIRGKPPYGFKWENRNLVQVSGEAEIRRLAYDLFLEHRRKGVVARLLNEKGWRTREGNPFRDMGIGRMLECPSAVGKYRAGLRGGEPGGVIECEPIVPGEIYRQVLAVLEHQLKPVHRPAKKPVSVFGGLLQCGCGGRLYLGSRSPNYTCRKCGNRIAAVELDRFFSDIIGEELTGMAAAEGADTTEIWASLTHEEKQRMAGLICTAILIPVNPEDPIGITMATA